MDSNDDFKTTSFRQNPYPEEKTIPSFRVDNEKSASFFEAQPFSSIKREKFKRKSYAGNESRPHQYLPRSFEEVKERRKSMVDLLSFTSSERVIQRMNFGFTVDLPADKTCSSTNGSRDSPFEEIEFNFDHFNNDDPVMLTFKSLGNEVSSEVDFDAIEITNRALSLEREYLENCANSSGEAIESANTFDRIMQVTANGEPLMAFYYLDEQNRVKVTEIFNMPGNNSRKSLDVECGNIKRHTENTSHKNYDIDKEEDGLSSHNESQTQRS